MGKLAGYLWLALCVTLLGWYGWAMVAIGTVLYVAIALIVNNIKEKRERRERDRERYGE